MGSYNSIVVAVDLNEDAIFLVEKAKQLLTEMGTIEIVHVGSILATLMPVSSMGGSVLGDVEVFQKEYSDHSINYLQQIAYKTNIAHDHVHLLFGSEVHEIRQFAEDNGSQLLVIGLRESKGINRILGSVARGALKHAPCDILSVLV